MVFTYAAVWVLQRKSSSFLKQKALADTTYRLYLAKKSLTDLANGALTKSLYGDLAKRALTGSFYRELAKRRLIEILYSNVAWRFLEILPRGPLLDEILPREL